MKKNNKAQNTKKKTSRMRTDGFHLTALLHNLKKLFLPWLTVSVLSVFLIVGSNLFFSNEVDSVSATISFYYNGIEEGFDPNGCEFDKTAIKDEKVILEALNDMNLSEDILESVQNGIFIDSVVSTSAINNITSYNSIYDSDSSSWIESMKDSSYHPTAYSVSFNYSNTSLDGNSAAELLNLILEKYKMSFFNTYGYNESVSDSVLSVDFSNYDYLIALDMYSSKLISLENYVDTLSSDDKAQFRSETTGYSFSDLTNSIKLIRTVDVDTITSYILNNGVISDKKMILSYYNFRLDNLKRQKQNTVERLNSTTTSIKDYQKDSIVIYDGSVANATSITETSEVYDNLIQEKIQLQDTVSLYESQITDYTDRINKINNASSSTSDSKKKYVESQIQKLTDKSTELIDNIRLTANDYYSNVKFTNAVSITSPASYSFSQYIKSAVNESIRMLVITELTLMSFYFFAAIVFCLKSRLTVFMKARPIKKF